jgi:hypothetical protein
LTCITIACGSLFWGLLIKLILPAKWFLCLVTKDKELTDEQEKKSIVAMARVSQRQQSLKRQQSLGKKKAE